MLCGSDSRKFKLPYGTLKIIHYVYVYMVHNTLYVTSKKHRNIKIIFKKLKYLAYTIANAVVQIIKCEKQQSYPS